MHLLLYFYKDEFIYIGILETFHYSYYNLDINFATEALVGKK